MRPTTLYLITFLSFSPSPQNQIEALEEVERGFVHLDVDATHPFEHVVKD
jgi:hypothetical protein